MTDDVARLLRSADGGPARPDHDDIARRGRRLRTTRTAAVVAVVVVVAAGALGVVAGLAGAPRIPVIDEPDEVAPAPSDPEEPAEPAEPAEPEGDRDPAPPSQSLADARRDGVIDEIARLPFDVRVRPDLADGGRGEQRIETEEGVWMVSRPDWAALDPSPPTVGDDTGQYGRDWFGASGYGEVLLLDADETRILRAYPFPDAGPQALVATEEAVYCMRQGDGGLPASMLCRIDRVSRELTVRIFPWDEGSHFLDPEQMYLPDTWSVDAPRQDAPFGDLLVVNGELSLVREDARVRVDPVTLELLPEDEGPEPTAEDRQLIADFLAFADAPGTSTAAEVRFADEVTLGLANELHRTVGRDDLEDPAVWAIDVEEFRAYVGPFSALDVAADAGPTQVSLGDHPHCASPPELPPDGYADHRRVSVQPDSNSIDSCLQWWTVDLFVGDDGRVAAVTLDLWEP